MTIEAAMRIRYAQPEWALLFGVANATGWKGKGWADAIAMSLYPSRGLAVHGFEFKASRGDWKRELANPAKAENVARYCDYWWLVCPEKVLQSGELPLGWGVLELDGRGLVARVAAERLNPAPLDRGFVAAVLRRASEADAAAVGAIADKKIMEMRKEDERRYSERTMRDRAKLTDLETKLKALEAETGIDMLTYRPVKEIAAAIKLAHRAGYHGLHAEAERMAKEAEDFAAVLRKHIE